MAKKAGKKSHSASTEKPNKNESLKPKSPEKMKITTRSSIVSAITKNPISPNKSKAKPKKRTVKEDRNKPKKPPTAFFYFLEDFRKEYQVQNPDVKSMRDVGKACGVKWKTMRYEEKIKYYDIATEKRAEFDEAIAEYERKKESGEDQDDLEDSEFDEY